YLYFFFQAEDGIRDFHVTGVQTCALPIFVLMKSGSSPLYLVIVIRLFPLTKTRIVFRPRRASVALSKVYPNCTLRSRRYDPSSKIGRASCRERVWISWLGG